MTMAHSSTPSDAASSLPIPNSSQETLAGSPSVCSTNTQTPRYSASFLARAAASGSISSSTGAAVAASSARICCSSGVKCITRAEAGQILTHFWQPMHLAASMIGSPLSVISTQLTGQTLWQRAPQAMQALASNWATPRGFLGFGFCSVMDSNLFQMFKLAAYPWPAVYQSTALPSRPDRHSRRPEARPGHAPGKRSWTPRLVSLSSRSSARPAARSGCSTVQPWPHWRPAAWAPSDSGAGSTHEPPSAWPARGLLQSRDDLPAYG